MPRLTRDKQFQESFQEFMVSYRDLHYPYLQDDGWSLESLTKNKSSSLHQYAIKISKHFFVYNIDAYTDPQGVFHPACIERGETDMPSPTEFTTIFNNHYGKFIMKQRDVLMSYTSLAKVGNNDAGDLEATVVICYYKSYLPYPSKNKTYEQLKERCDHLEQEQQGLYDVIDDWHTLHTKQAKDIKKLKKQLSRLQVDSVIEMREIVNKMQAKIREFYGESDKKEDCPVCYECIDSRQLVVPKCCHYICGSCYDRCENCPICRVEY